MLRFVCFAILCLVTFREAIGHTAHAGRCPLITPVTSFDMQKFMGTWYVIQETTNEAPCIQYTITYGDEPGSFKLRETSYKSQQEINYSQFYTLKAKDPDNPARFKMKASTPLTPSSTFTVFLTDYTNYAAVYNCQNNVLVYRQSIVILSRQKTLNPAFIDTIHAYVTAQNFPIENLTSVDQTACRNAAVPLAVQG